jgi:hypothetical protein
MTSTYLSNSNGKAAVLFGIDIANRMQKYGIKIYRVKVETSSKNPELENFKKTLFYKNNLQYYYEFHFKVDIRSDEDQEIVDKICNQYQGSSYAINFLSKNRYAPLITYRARGDYSEANKMRDTLVAHFQKDGIKVLDTGVHYEFTIFDSNYKTDQGMVPDPIEL